MREFFDLVRKIEGNLTIKKMRHCLPKIHAIEMFNIQEKVSVIFWENLQFFPKFCQMFIKFFEKIWAKISKYQKYAFVRSSRGGVPRSQRIYFNKSINFNILVEKSTETCNFLKILMEILPCLKILQNFIQYFAKIWSKIQNCAWLWDSSNFHNI